MPTQTRCTRCSYIASNDVCKACVLLEGLNRGLPKYARVPPPRPDCACDPPMLICAWTPIPRAPLGWESERRVSFAKSMATLRFSWRRLRVPPARSRRPKRTQTLALGADLSAQTPWRSEPPTGLHGAANLSVTDLDGRSRQEGQQVLVQSAVGRARLDPVVEVDDVKSTMDEACRHHGGNVHGRHVPNRAVVCSGGAAKGRPRTRWSGVSSTSWRSCPPPCRPWFWVAVRGRQRSGPPNKPGDG